MLPVARPPPTCQRLAAASDELAYTFPSDDRLYPFLSVLNVLCMVLLAILIIVFFLLAVIVIIWDYVHPTSLPSEGAQPASPPVSDDTVDHGPMGTAAALIGVVALFLMFFLFFLNAIRLANDPVPFGYRRARVAPSAAPHGRPPLGAPSGLDPAVILASQPVVHSASQLPEAGSATPRVEVKVEACPPSMGQEQIQPSNQWEKIESGIFNDRNPTHGSGGIHEFSRSHSTGHSLTRPGAKQLIDRPGPVLPLESCSREGYRCGGEGSSLGRYYFRSPDRLDRATKSERWAFNRLSSTVAADGGGGVQFNGLDQPFRA